MLKLIVGVKGTGKTKTLIEHVNGAAKTSKGAVVCIECGSKLNFDVTYKARLVDTKAFGISGGDALYGFVAGMAASNHDITDIYIDSALKICDNDMAELEKFVLDTAKLLANSDMKCEMTVSADTNDIPDSIKDYVK